MTTSNEQIILPIWEKFTLSPMEKTVDFFDSGGDSLGAVNMIVEIQKHFKVDISLEKFMRNPTFDFLIGVINQ